jgi:hypothetical protein
VDAPVKKALVFTMEGNVDGEAALAFFQARGVAVDVRDVGKDPQASQALFARAGRLGVPTVVLGERVFDGFGAHREEIEALLRD